MAITYLPSKILRKVAKKKDLKELVTDNMSLNRTALRTASELSFLPSKKIEEVAMRVIGSYKKRYSREREDGLPKREALKDTLNNKKLVVQRVQNATIHEIAKDIKEKYLGKKYEWLPSDSNEPDPEHQLLYGTVRTIGVGEMPGDRWGCKCGMRILTDEEVLNL